MQENKDKTLALLLLCIILAWTVFTIVAIFILPREWRDLVVIPVYSFTFFIIFVFTLRPFLLLPKSRKAGGELIVTARLRLIFRIAYLLLAVLQLGVSCQSLSLVLDYFNNDPLQIAISVFMPIMTFYWGSKAFQQVEFRERGICSGATFVAWENIQSYSWTDPEGRYLSIILKKPVRLFKGHSWAITKEYREAVNKVMLQKVFYRGNSGEALEGIGL